MPTELTPVYTAGAYLRERCRCPPPQNPQPCSAPDGMQIQQALQAIVHICSGRTLSIRCRRLAISGCGACTQIDHLRMAASPVLGRFQPSARHRHLWQSTAVSGRASSAASTSLLPHPESDHSPAKNREFQQPDMLFDGHTSTSSIDQRLAK